MKPLFSVQKIQSCTWDFAKDGGAIAVYPTGVTIGANCVVQDVIIEVVNTVNSGGFGATLSIGYNGTPGYYFSNALAGPFDRTQSFDLGFFVSPGGEILFEISNDTLISGKIKLHFLYVESF